MSLRAVWDHTFPSSNYGSLHKTVEEGKNVSNFCLIFLILKKQHGSTHQLRGS